MRKLLIHCFTLIWILCCFTGCTTITTQPKNNNSDQLSIVTTIFPQYDFARQIAGDHANITMLLKPGAESHSYEPTPQDMKAIENCDLFIYTGGENDVWVDDLLQTLGEKKPDTLRLIDCVPTMNEEIVEGMEHEHEHETILEADIKDRPLSDFLGDYQSVLPYFENGTLDAYISQEAEEHEKSFDTMKQEFLKRKFSDYKTISIQDSSVTVTTSSGSMSGEYAYTGFQTEKDDDGDIRSVWYGYKIKSPIAGMPMYLTFNDHEIGETHSEEDEQTKHIHMRYGNDSIEALMDVDDWAPTYFVSDATAEEIRTAITEHTHHDEEMDEHVWTSPTNAIKIVNKISELMCEKDKKNADTYTANCKEYIAQLESLDQAFIEVVENAKRKTILFGDRFPFLYFAKQYGLNYFAAFTGCSSETEASAATVKFLIDRVKAEDIPVVFTIELSNEKIADSICEATGAKKLTLYSCHNITKEQMETGETYLSMMTKNVESLRTALN